MSDIIALAKAARAQGYDGPERVVGCLEKIIALYQLATSTWPRMQVIEDDNKVIVLIESRGNGKV